MGCSYAASSGFGGEGALEAFEEPAADAVEGFVEGVDLAVGFAGDFLDGLVLVVTVFEEGAGGSGQFFNAAREGLAADIEFFVVGFVFGGEGTEGGIGEEVLRGVLAFAEVEDGEVDEATLEKFAKLIYDRAANDVADTANGQEIKNALTDEAFEADWIEQMAGDIQLQELEKTRHRLMIQILEKGGTSTKTKGNTK